MDLKQIITAAVTSRIDELVKDIADDVIADIKNKQPLSSDLSTASLLTQILKGDPFAADLRLKEQGISFHQISDMLVVEPKTQQAEEVQTALSAALREEKRLYLNEILDGRLVILTSFSCNNLDLEEEIKFYINTLDAASTVFFYTGAKDIPEIQKNYIDYCQNAAALRKIFQSRQILNVHDVNLSKNVLTLSRADKEKHSRLLSIIDALKDDHDNLLETLAIYLIDCDAQLNKAAQTLFLHRNTVSYRLNKIKEMTNTDFSKMPAAYDFYTAAALWRMTAG